MLLFDSEKPCTLIRAGRRELTDFGQLGTSFGLAITTIVYNTILERDSLALGVDLDVHGAVAPRAAQLHGYHDANWTAFAFGILGKSTCLFPSWDSTLFCPFCCGGSLECPIRPEWVKLEKATIAYGMCYSKFGK